MANSCRVVAVIGLALPLASCLARPCTCASSAPSAARPAGPCANAPSTLASPGSPSQAPALKPTAGAGTPASGTVAGPPPTTPATTGQRLVVWDGDSEGLSAKGWADCEKKPDCKASVATVPGVGLGKTNGLKFHGEGAGWVGFGWNLFGWWPADAGVDIAPFKFLRLAFRIVVSNPEHAPNLGSLNLHLVCSSKKDKCASAVVNLGKLSEENLLDGKWHQVAVPVAQLTSNQDFDPKTVWEIDIDSWSETHKKFDLYFDDFTLSTD